MKLLKKTRALLTLIPSAASLLLGLAEARAASYSSTVLADNPAAYYRLEELPGASVAADEKGNFPGSYAYSLDANSNPNYPALGRNGIETNSVFVHYYNDTNNAPHYGLVSIPYNAALDPTNGFSIELWARPTILTSGGDYRSPAGFFGGYTAANGYSGSGWKFYQQPGANNWVFVMDPGVAFISGGSITPLQWYHLVGVYNGTTATFYINGVSVGSQAISGYLPNGVNPLLIGARDPGFGYFDGNVDEVAFYTNSLTLTQVQSHYQTGTNSFASHTLAPVVVSDPAALTVAPGQSAQFSAGTEGTATLHYQWFRAGSAIAGATASAYSFTASFADDGVFYSVLVTNNFGSVLSTGGKLTVLTMVINYQPISITRHVGSMAAFRVVADGAKPITNQWFKGNTPIPGATNDTLWLSNVQPGDDGTTYYAHLSNAFTSTNSTTNTLTVDARSVTNLITGYARVVAADGPVAYWRLDEPDGSGPATDTVGSFDGTYLPRSGTITYGVTNGIPHETNAAINVTQQAIVSIPYALELNPVSGPWSAEAWIKPASVDPGHFRTAFSSMQNVGFSTFLFGWNIYQHVAGCWTLNVFNGGGSSSFLSDYPPQFPVVANKWYHLVITYDNVGAIRLYVNAVLVASAPFSVTHFVANGINGDPAVAGRPTVLGQRGDDAFDPFDGSVDDVAFYNYALTPTQIGLHFQNNTRLTIRKQGTNVVLTWPFGALQAAPKVTGTYTNIPGATSPYTNAANAPQKHYRVQTLP